MRPAHSVYTIRLQYVRRYWLGEMEITNGYIPEVTLLDPALQLEHPRTGEFVPHVYWREDNARAIHTLLLRPGSHQWSSDDFMADTIVPWACDWLACYEGWLATGNGPAAGGTRRRAGGGRAHVR